MAPKSNTNQILTTSYTEIEQISTVRPKPYKIYNTHSEPVTILLNGDNDVVTLFPNDIYTVAAGTTASGSVEYGTGTIQVMQQSLHKGPASSVYGYDEVANETAEAHASSSYYVTLDGFSGATMQMHQTAGADLIGFTVGATEQADGTISGSCTYTDITQYGLDSLSAATTSGVLYGNQMVKLQYGSSYKYLEITATKTGSADDANYFIRIKKNNG